MTQNDLDYVRRLLRNNVIYSPCLELGIGYEGPNTKDLIESVGIKWFGSDMVHGKNVDYVVDLEKPLQEVENCFNGVKFGSILVLNVLEHVFNPIKVLDNVFHLLKRDGTCIIITPVVWPLHGFPYDYWRINPDFYQEYSKRRGHILLMEYFEYIGFGKVSGNALPKPSKSRFRQIWSRSIHKFFNTYGRGMLFPLHVAIGCVIKKGVET